MTLIQLPDLANFFQRPFITNMATQGIGRIGGISDDATRINDFGSLVDQPGLWIFRMNSEELTHFYCYTKKSSILAY